MILHQSNCFMKLSFSSWLPRFWLLLCVILTVIPLTVIMTGINEFDHEIWTFLLEYQLPLLLKNTLFLALGVGSGVFILGTSAAWLTAMYNFPLRKFFFWAMMLPLAIPAYVLAFTQVGMLDYSSPINTWFRENYAWEIPNVRNGYGLVFVMSLTFYPYVYLLARNAFSGMGQRALEAGASLGLPPYKSFLKIALPMARPWLAGGTILALMETLADFGTVSIFSFETFTTAIYEAWFSMFSLQTAKQLAALLITAVFILLVLEQLSRGNRRFERRGRTTSIRTPLTGTKKWLATTYCSIILIIAFIIPMIQLIWWAYENWQTGWNNHLWMQAWHSFAGGMLAATLTAAVALLLALSKRTDKSRFAAIAARIATLGYGVPGTVLSVGVFVPVAYFDNFLIAHFHFPPETTGIFKGTLGVMMIAYLIRFLAIAYTSAESGLERISPSQSEVARSLGCTSTGVLKRVYMPLMKSSIATAMLMVFVDVMKEMPITLMMRPYDWETLAWRIYSFTTEGQFADAALPAILIVLTGLIPVILFSRTEQAS